jgi:hypothetical protein
MTPLRSQDVGPEKSLQDVEGKIKTREVDSGSFGSYLCSGIWFASLVVEKWGETRNET